MAKKLTPMMLQYMEIKERYKDCILFFRLGDFYEMFFDDALVASKELEITLTGRECGQEKKAPMCGVPFHAAENYINKLIEKGYKVAICEQVEDASVAKGIVKRDVIRVVTPGTTLNMQSLDAAKHNYLMCLYGDNEHYGIAYVDITTGDYCTTQVNNVHILLDEIGKINPSEIIYNDSIKNNSHIMEAINQYFKIYSNLRDERYFDHKRCVECIQQHFKISGLYGLGLSSYEQATIASGVLLEYLYETQKQGLTHITHLQLYSTTDFMLLDLSTRRNLELVETMRGKERKGSLLWVLDRTKTAMGARMLRSYIEQPLIDPTSIEQRLLAVEELVNNTMLREEIRELLTPVYDLERLMSKISCQTANCRDLIAFKQSLSVLPELLDAIGICHNPLFLELVNTFDTLNDLWHLIEVSIHDEPPVSVKDGDIIKDGYNSDIDELREACHNGKTWLAELEAKERVNTGIKNLKIKFNKVFGYYIEVTKSYLHLVPEERYTRKQTLANAERYITDELKEMESVILGAEEKIVVLEYQLFVEIRNKLALEVERIKNTANSIANIDVFQSLSDVAIKQNYIKPSITAEKDIHIKDGRHPVVEKMIDSNMFVTNDTYLNGDDHRFSIITGPNMAGKSTYMRQVALITLMAQIGSFVPASEAVIGTVDRIFTRVGASDDLASGQSTFMVEMTEVANILRNATKNSLIILDEIGRGTSTFDGLSIAWAVVEYLADQNVVGAKSLFATHYHELTELEGKIEGVVNYCIDVKEKGDDIIFLRKIIKGGANKSYGIQVAKLAGVPTEVLDRANVLLNELSDADIAKHAETIMSTENINYTVDEKEETTQLQLFDNTCHEVLDILKETDVNQLTPMDALMLIHKLQQKI